MTALVTGDITAAREAVTEELPRCDEPVGRALRLAAALAGHADRGR